MEAARRAAVRRRGTKKLGDSKAPKNQRDREKEDSEGVMLAMTIPTRRSTLMAFPSSSPET